MNIFEAARRPTRPGNVWLVEIYPGGRKLLTQMPPSYIESVEAAYAALTGINPRRTFVAVRDAATLVKRLQRIGWPFGVKE